MQEHDLYDLLLTNLIYSGKHSLEKCFTAKDAQN